MKSNKLSITYIFGSQNKFEKSIQFRIGSYNDTTLEKKNRNNPGVETDKL